MVSDVICVNESDTVYQVRMLMKDRGVRHLPVVENHQLRGIITLVDFIKLAAHLPKQAG